MKRFLFSGFLKTLAVLIFIFCIVISAYYVSEFCIDLIDSDMPFIYSFEDKYTDMHYLISPLMSTNSAVYDAFYRVYYKNEGDLDAILKEELNHMYWLDKIYYHVNINGQVYTNCNDDPEDFINYEFYSFVQKDSDGSSFIDISHSNLNNHWDLYYYGADYYGAEGSTVKIHTAINPSFAKECKVLWEVQRSRVLDTITNVAMIVLCGLLSFIYLVCVCGKNKNGESISMWIDGVWTEIHLIFAGGSVLGALLLSIALLETCSYSYFSSRIITALIMALAAVAGSIFLLSSLSLVRKIKHKTFVRESAILRLCMICLKAISFIAVSVDRLLRMILRSIKRSGRRLLGALSIKTGLIMIALLVVYSFFLVLTAIGVAFDVKWILGVFFTFACGCFVVVNRASDIDRIRKGVCKIQSGDLSHKIEGVRSDDLKRLATSINGIAKGFDESVSDKLRAERLKTELITNVSHDIKTPLTSIINYTVLLSQVEGLPEEARDYVRILSDKSIRLKNLTADLFDISKVQSGNEVPDLERLDLSLLVQQSVAEYDGEIKASSLTFCYNLSKEMFIIADGRKMSRVINNLLSNVLKYTMSNTRVFITTSTKGSTVSLEIKNVASYPMDFDDGEITGRFVRGDKSRTTEGNGLGLAIAKSYTELCGGSFSVVTDGDLFKVILEFNKAD